MCTYLWYTICHPWHENMQSQNTVQVQQNVHDNAHAIACLVKFCVDVNIGTLDNAQFLLKSIVCNMQYIHKQHLFAKLFGKDSYVNWELSETMLKRSMSKRKVNAIGGVNVWFYLMLYINGDHQKYQLHALNVRNMYRPFALIVEACTNEFVGTGVHIDFATMARLFFTIHLIGIQPVHAISTLLNPIVSKHTMNVFASYAQNMALRILEEKFTPEQYIDTVFWLVTQKIVFENTELLMKEVDFHHEREKKNPQNMMKMHSIQATKSTRPSLIAIAKNKKQMHFGKRLPVNPSIIGTNSVSASLHNDLPAKGLVGSAVAENNGSTNILLGMEGYFTLDGFKQFMKFPSNFSPVMQQRAYWLASQTCFDWKLYVRDFLPKDLCPVLMVCSSSKSLLICQCT